MAAYTTLGSLITPAETVRCGSGKYPVLSMTMYGGIVLQRERFKKSLASIDQSDYKVVRRGQLVVGFPIDEGVLYFQEAADEGIMSPAYQVWDVNTAQIYPDYLELCLHSPQSMQYYKDKLRGTTARRRSIPTADLLALRICIPDMETQRRTVTVLNQLDLFIDKRRQQLAKLDELVKSRFIELFGVPGAKSDQWPRMSLGDCCILNPKKNLDTRLVPELNVSFVPMSAVSEDGDMEVSETRKYEDVKTGFTYFADNDILFAKITPCMENGKGAIAGKLINGIGFGSTEFHVLRPIQNKSNPYWLYVMTALESFRTSAKANMTGSAGQKRVPASYLEAYQVSLPPMELQEQFASFVKQTNLSKPVIRQSLDQLETLKKSLMQAYFS
ncbi:restriction endonuclease subunit S [uncultured Oscillibacter sp.]|uniref:restriction endonuclease subunit S n=1 Tax=uncultured Oscillibacter sp. TaxID=876091 RepID=UPI002630B2C9|nr:restriction endonuclease subunit S [uncultured Oscillibacter sp.]